MTDKAFAHHPGEDEEQTKAYADALERELASSPVAGDPDRAAAVQRELERVRPHGGAKRTRLRGEKA